MLQLNDDVTFKRITIDDKVYFLQCQQNGNDVTLKLTNGGDVFFGEVTKDDISKMGKLLDDMPSNKLHELLLQCLSTKTSSNQFDYQLSLQGDVYKFNMKQVLEGGIKFQLGSLEMRKTEESPQYILTFLDRLTDQVDSLKKNVTDLRHENETIVTEQQEITKRLTNYVVAKDTLENELYTKFSMVLNEKKAKIRELKEQIEAGVKISSRVPEQPIVDEEVETDDEKEQLTSKKKYMKKDVSNETIDDKPSTSTTMMEENIRLDDSINADVDEVDLPRRSRKRMRASKPKTPTNPLLPRTTSLPRPKSSQSSSQRSSRRQSSKEVSADDLLNEL